MTLGKGKAYKVGDRDMAQLADRLGVHPADLEAIAMVESKGDGWTLDGRLKILFEKHWFYKFIQNKTVRDQAVKAGLARAKWVHANRGGYKDQNTTAQRYALLEKAIQVNKEAAFKSISMGEFQIMGFNHELCGFRTAEGMFHAFCDSEFAQLEAFGFFLKGKNLLPALRSRDFARVEKVYNGGGLNGAYAKRMKAESDRLRKGKWANYKPGSAPAKEQKTITPTTTAPVAESKGGFWEAIRRFFRAIIKGGNNVRT